MDSRSPELSVSHDAHGPSSPPSAPPSAAPPTPTPSPAPSPVHGRVKTTCPEKGYGHLTDEHGQTRFFHVSQLFGITLEALLPGERVTCIPDDTSDAARSRGPRANNVWPIRVLSRPPEAESGDAVVPQADESSPAQTTASTTAPNPTTTPNPTLPARILGTVRLWTGAFGFIVSDAGDPHIFVHQDDVITPEIIQLYPRDRVSFELVAGPQGPRAARVEVIGRAPIL